MPKSMKVFYDFEFKETRGVVDKISLGMVREDAQELYIVFNSFDTQAVVNDWWLMKNVMSSIDYEEVTSHICGLGTPVKDMIITDKALCSPVEARLKVTEFVCDIWPDFWAWYGAYDHVALCSMFGSMMDLPKNFPMFTQDIKQLHKAKGSPDMPKQPEGLHNALADARFNIVRYNHLIEMPDAKPGKKILHPEGIPWI